MRASLARIKAPRASERVPCATHARQGCGASPCQAHDASPGAAWKRCSGASQKGRFGAWAKRSESVSARGLVVSISRAQNLQEVY